MAKKTKEEDLADPGPKRTSTAKQVDSSACLVPGSELPAKGSNFSGNGTCRMKEGQSPQGNCKRAPVQFDNGLKDHTFCGPTGSVLKRSFLSSIADIVRASIAPEVDMLASFAPGPESPANVLSSEGTQSIKSNDSPGGYCCQKNTSTEKLSCHHGKKDCSEAHESFSSEPDDQKKPSNIFSPKKRRGHVNCSSIFKGCTLRQILGSFIQRRTFTTSVPHSFRNSVVWSLDGNGFQILSSFINAIVHFRFWNMSRGTCVDISPAVGYERKLYTVSADGTFHFLVEYGGQRIDFVFDGRQSWFYGLIKDDMALEFAYTGNTGYINVKGSEMLEFSGHYAYIAPKQSPGQIEIGLSALIAAFDEIIRVFKGGDKKSSKFKFALGTFVIYLGEASKFHQVFYCCCKSLLLDGILTLDMFDKSLGLMVKKWGKFCEIVMQNALANNCVPDLDEELPDIVSKGVPSVKTMRDVLDNICLWTFNSPKGQHFRYPKWLKDPTYVPIQLPTEDLEADRIINFFRKKIYGNDDSSRIQEGDQEERTDKNEWFGGYDDGTQLNKADFVVRHCAALFYPSSWHTGLPINHSGIYLSRSVFSMRRRQFSTFASGAPKIQSSSLFAATIRNYRRFHAVARRVFQYLK